jgi:hypothetical protein
MTHTDQCHLGILQGTTYIPVVAASTPIKTHTTRYTLRHVLHRYDEELCVASSNRSDWHRHHLDRWSDAVQADVERSPVLFAQAL